ncbi:hypothetical protein EYR38_003531 [Pleurotus pulmonarius]|nr:hypothetical protein EYR38_003531 [Pleurotus pulmonarius]
MQYLIFTFLLLAAGARAGVYITRPSAGSTCRGGEQCTLQWMDDGQSPLLSAFGPSTAGLYTGQMKLVQPLGDVDTSGSRSFAFTVDPRAGPNSNDYYIALVSKSLGEMAWSPFFSMTNMDGSFDLPLPSSAIPSLSTLSPPQSSSTTILPTITVGTLSTLPVASTSSDSLSPSSPATPTTSPATSPATPAASSGTPTSTPSSSTKLTSTSSSTPSTPPTSTPSTLPQATNTTPAPASTDVVGATSSRFVTATVSPSPDPTAGPASANSSSNAATASSCISLPLISFSVSANELHLVTHELSQSESSYTVTELLGEGSHGKVLLARARGCPHGLAYAIKVLRREAEQVTQKPHWTRELELLEWIAGRPQDGTSSGVRFLQKMIKGFARGDHLFIVMDRHCASLADPAIAQRLNLSTSVSPHSLTGLSASVSLPLDSSSLVSDPRPHHEVLATLRFLAAEIVLGLLFLHEHGIVHQDIKPANIMVSFAGHIVIGDFGAANLLDSDWASTEATSPVNCIVVKPEERVMHTPLYAAPELVTRTPSQLLVYGQHVDWWALGVTLYELSTGDTPFPLSHRLQLSADHASRIYSRRSDGDTSISFGAFEKIMLDLSGCAGHRDRGIVHFESLLKGLLVHDPEYRLHGARVKEHGFFALMNDLDAGCSWEDVLGMRCPPLPDPICSDGGEGVSGGAIGDGFGLDDIGRLMAPPDAIVEGDAGDTGDASARVPHPHSMHELRAQRFDGTASLHSAGTLRDLPEIPSLPDLKGEGPTLPWSSEIDAAGSSSACSFYRPSSQRHTSDASSSHGHPPSASPPTSPPRQRNRLSSAQSLGSKLDSPFGSMFFASSPEDADERPIMSVSGSISGTEDEAYSPPQPWPSTCSLVDSIKRNHLNPHAQAQSAIPLPHRSERPPDLCYGSEFEHGNQMSPIIFHRPVLDSTFGLIRIGAEDFSMIEKDNSYGSNFLSLGESWTFEENITIAILDAIVSRPRSLNAPQLHKSPPAQPTYYYERKLSCLQLKRLLVRKLKHFMKHSRFLRSLWKARP